MTTAAANRLTPETVREIQAMLRAADELGCQLRPSPTYPTRHQGLCPFHQATANSDRQSLQINVDTGRFRCTACDTRGNSTSFLALVWGVSARDAHILYEANPEAGRERPPYPAGYFTPAEGRLRPQNTAALTKAAQLYSDQLTKHYAPLTLLAALGVNPEAAAAAGIGYCSGEGQMAEYLADPERQPLLTAEEIQECGLLHPVTGQETLYRQMVIADQDHLGATLWLGCYRPDTTSLEDLRWSPRRPDFYGITGTRQLLLNAYGINPQQGFAILTDDVRLYILLAAQRQPAALLTQRRRRDYPVDNLVERTIPILERRRVKKLVIASHDENYRRALHRLMAEKLQPENVISYNKEVILRTLDRTTRDLSIFTRFPEPQPRAAARQNETEEQPAKTEADSTPAATSAAAPPPQAPASATAEPIEAAAEPSPQATNEAVLSAAEPEPAKAFDNTDPPEPNAEPDTQTDPKPETQQKEPSPNGVPATTTPDAQDSAASILLTPAAAGRRNRRPLPAVIAQADPAE